MGACNFFFSPLYSFSVLLFSHLGFLFSVHPPFFYYCLPCVSLFIAVSFFFPVVPRPGLHRRPMTAPKTQKDKESKRKRVLLTVLAVVVLLGILVTAGYFSESQFLDVVSTSKNTHKHQWMACSTGPSFMSINLDTRETCFAKV